MKAKVLGMLMAALMDVLTPERLREFCDMVFDWCEDRILGSASEIDDKLVLPIIKLARTTFNVPDDD